MYRYRLPQSPDTPDGINVLKNAIIQVDTVIIGAGAGLSASAGYIYSGERFQKYFADFIEKYHFADMYAGGFYPFETMEEFWGYWSRYIWINRYMPIPSDLYEKLFDLVKDKDYFVITTNVDHCFQRAGFDKKRLFYTQGDYGLLQSSNPHGISAGRTYDNEEIIRQMVLSQGFEIKDDNTLMIPEGAKLKMTIPARLIPYCPDDGELMTTNLRADENFVEDEGWHLAAQRYAGFLRTRENTRVLFLELGVGMNTPGIIKFPFWKMTGQWPDASYACLNYDEAYAPQEIIGQSIIINGDISDAIELLRNTV